MNKCVEKEERSASMNKTYELEDSVKNLALQQTCYYIIEQVVLTIDDISIYLPKHKSKLEDIMSDLRDINNQIYKNGENMVENINEKFH